MKGSNIQHIHKQIDSFVLFDHMIYFIQFVMAAMSKSI